MESPLWHWLSRRGRSARLFCTRTAYSPGAAGFTLNMPRWFACCWLVVVALLVVESHVLPRWTASTEDELSRLASGARPPLCADDALRCFLQLSPQPWLAVYGDSISRGIFFDLADLLNTTDEALRTGCWPTLASAPAHPGHSANYSDGCQLIDYRPPTRRPKCGAFELLTAHWPHRLRRLASRVAGRVRPMVASLAAGAVAPLSPLRLQASGRRLRLSYRLKTFAWEEEYDRPWLSALRHAPRLPDVIVLSFGLWDMQYPPAGAAPGGASAFNSSLWTFLAEFHGAIDDARRRMGQPVRLSGNAAAGQNRRVGGRERGEQEEPRAGASRGGPRPHVVWLSVGAISAAALPAWKRPLLTSETARAYNALAAPALAFWGVTVVDTFRQSARHPHLSSDGVHYPGAVSRHHAQELLRAVLPHCVSTAAAGVTSGSSDVPRGRLRPRGR